MARNFYYFTRNSYAGGTNNANEPDQLDDDECVLIQNGITNATGYLDKRSGNDFVGKISTSLSTAVFTGSGLDDLTEGGSFTSFSTPIVFLIEIDGEGTPDTFKWSIDNGDTWVEGVEITGSTQELTNGITITFNASTGHTLTDKWAFSASMATSSITGLATLITDAGVVQELRTQGTKLEYNDSGTWTEIGSDVLTTGLDNFFTQAGNKIYISNGIDDNASYDGTTFTSLDNNTYPKAKYTAFWKNYLFICGDGVLNGTNHHNRVWFSNLGNPDTITTGTDYFDVGKSDGQAITGIAPLGEFLVIFKRKSVYILSGANPNAWKLADGVNNLSQIANGIGCVSAKSIVQVGNDLWFMSDDGIRSVRRNEQGSIPLMGLVSGNIKQTISEINWSYAHRIAGAYFDNKVYMAIPTGTSTTNNKVLVANTAIQLEKPTNPYPWFIYTGWYPYCFNIHLGGTTPSLHYGDSISTNVIEAEVGSSDKASLEPIDFDVIGIMIDLRAPEMKKTARFIKYGVSGGGDYCLDLYTSTTGHTWELREQINLKQSSAWGTAIWGVDFWSFINEIKGKTALKIGSPQLMIRFRNVGNNQPVTLYPYTIAIKQRKIK